MASLISLVTYRLGDSQNDIWRMANPKKSQPRILIRGGLLDSVSWNQGIV